MASCNCDEFLQNFFSLVAYIYVTIIFTHLKDMNIFDVTDTEIFFFLKYFLINDKPVLSIIYIYCCSLITFRYRYLFPSKKKFHFNLLMYIFSCFYILLCGVDVVKDSWTMVFKKECDFYHFCFILQNTMQPFYIPLYSFYILVQLCLNYNSVQIKCWALLAQYVSFDICPSMLFRVFMYWLPNYCLVQSCVKDEWFMFVTIRCVS